MNWLRDFFRKKTDILPMKSYLPFVCILILSACAYKVRTYKSPEISMASRETWCWMQGCDMTYQGPAYYFDEEAQTEVMNAVAWNMQQKGYEQGDDQSDLLLNFYVILEKDSIETYREDDYLSAGYNQEPDWLENLYPEYQRFLKGSLVIDVIDRESSVLVWKSRISGYSTRRDPDYKKTIWEVVARAFKKMPESSASGPK
jgi:hypothetical protein